MSYQEIPIPTDDDRRAKNAAMVQMRDAILDAHVRSLAVVIDVPADMTIGRFRQMLVNGLGRKGYRLRSRYNKATQTLTCWAVRS